jgi:hypothetical protein
MALEIRHLFEGPEEDALARGLANAAASAFTGFLISKSQDMPFREMPDAETFNTRNGQIRAFPARLLGLPYDDLYIGFGWGNDPRRHASLVRAERPLNWSNDRPVERFYIIALWLGDHDPLNDTDLSWMVSRSSLIHEFIHYLDYGRGHETKRQQQLAVPKSNADWKRKHAAETKRQNASMSDPVAYYNDDLEMNAHFQQGANAISVSLMRQARGNPEQGARLLSDWPQFIQRYRSEFNEDWLRFLTPSNKHKFIRRLAKLFLAAQTAWPDVGMLRRALAMPAISEPL